MASYVPESGEVFQSQDGTVSVVIDDEFDPDYEPTREDIEEHAEFLGIDVATESDLLWIARECLKTPLPSQWKPCKTDTGEVYYFNFETGDSVWDHPMDAVFQAKVEEERGKRAEQRSSTSKPSKGPKTGSKEKRLEKGAAGNVDVPQVSQVARTTSSKSVASVKKAGPVEQLPKQGRLGSMPSGSPGGSGSSAPGASQSAPGPGRFPMTTPVGSALITSPVLAAQKGSPKLGFGPTAFVGSTFGSMAANAGPKDPKEVEAQMKKRIAERFAAERQSALQELEKEASALRNEQSRLLASKRAMHESAVKQELAQAAAEGERRIQREVGELQRRLQQEQAQHEERLKTLRARHDEEALRAFKAYDDKLREQRALIEAQASEKVQQTSSSVTAQLASFEQEEMKKMEEVIAKLQKEHEAKREEAIATGVEELAAAKANQQKLQDAESAQLRLDLRQQNEEALQELRDASDAVGADHEDTEKRGSEKYTQARLEFEAATDEARAKASAALVRLREEHAERLARARDEAARRREEVLAAASTLHKESESRCHERREVLEKEYETAKATYDAELPIFTKELEVQLSDYLALLDSQLTSEQQAAQMRIAKEVEETCSGLRRQSERRRQEMLRAMAERQTAAQGGDDPRKHASYTSLLEKLKAEWLLKHPDIVTSLPPMEEMVRAAKRALPSTGPAAPASDLGAAMEPTARQSTEKVVYDPPTAEQIDAEIQRQVTAKRALLEEEHKTRLNALRVKLAASTEKELVVRREELRQAAESRLRSLRSELQAGRASAMGRGTADGCSRGDAGSFVSLADAQERERELRAALEARLQSLAAERLAAKERQGDQSATELAQKPPPAPYTRSNTPTHEHTVNVVVGRTPTPTRVPLHPSTSTRSPASSYQYGERYVSPLITNISGNLLSSNSNGPLYFAGGYLAGPSPIMVAHGSTTPITLLSNYSSIPALSGPSSLRPSPQKTDELAEGGYHSAGGGFWGHSSPGGHSARGTMSLSHQLSTMQPPMAPGGWPPRAHPEVMRGRRSGPGDALPTHVDPVRHTVGKDCRGLDQRDANHTATSSQDVYEQRWLQARKLLDKRKRALKVRRSNLEKSRADWRHDALVAKERNDRTHAEFLKRMKVALNEEAESLNREVLALRRASTWLRDESRQYYHDHCRGAAPDAPHGGSEVRGPHLHGQPPNDDDDSHYLVHLLESMLQKTDTLKSQLSRGSGPGVALRGGDGRPVRETSTRPTSPPREGPSVEGGASKSSGNRQHPPPARSSSGVQTAPPAESHASAPQ